jgi:hypothetical protein
LRLLLATKIHITTSLTVMMAAAGDNDNHDSYEDHDDRNNRDNRDSRDDHNDHSDLNDEQLASTVFPSAIVFQARGRHWGEDVIFLA